MHLCFPYLHPELVAESARRAMPESLRFLDPGVGDPRSRVHLPPEAAPFDRRTARALLTDTLRYGETVGDSRDLVAQTLARQAGALSDEGSGKVLGEVESAVLAGVRAAAGGDDPLLAARRQAQMLLLLAWNLEERLIELRGIDAGLRASWERLGRSVARDDAEADDESDQEALALGRELSGMNPPEGSPLSVPWRGLIESFALLEPGAVLCAPLSGVAEALADSGAAAGPADAAPGAGHVFRDAVWKLAGLGRLPEARPWLAAELTIAVYAPEDEPCPC